MEIIDQEWDNAKKANEPYLYFKCTRKDGSYCIKRYKPSMARLVSKRTGLLLEVVDTFIC